MEEHLLYNFIELGKLEEIKKYVTAENINNCFGGICFPGNTLLDIFSFRAKNNKKWGNFLHYCFDLGAVIKCKNDGWNILHTFTYDNSFLLLKIAIERSIKNKSFHSLILGSHSLYRIAIEAGNEDCAILLIDAGIKPETRIPKVLSFIKSRKRSGEAAVIVLGMLKTKSKVLGNNGNHVLTIISRCIWGNRGIPIK